MSRRKIQRPEEGIIFYSCVVVAVVVAATFVSNFAVVTDVAVVNTDKK